MVSRTFERYTFRNFGRIRFGCNGFCRVSKISLKKFFNCNAVITGYAWNSARLRAQQRRDHGYHHRGYHKHGTYINARFDYNNNDGWTVGQQQVCRWVFFILPVVSERDCRNARGIARGRDGTTRGGGGVGGNWPNFVGSVYRPIDRRTKTGRRDRRRVSRARMSLSLLSFARCYTRKRTFLPVPADDRAAFNNTVYPTGGNNNDRGNVFGFACDPLRFRPATAAAAARRGRIHVGSVSTHCSIGFLSVIHPVSSNSAPNEKQNVLSAR